MASSVAEPEVNQEANGAHGTNGLKRRQSDTSEQGNKRQRTSPGKSSPTAVEDEPAKDSDNTAKPPEKAADACEERKKSGVKDEKQRSKRLFGALLGNLNRPSDRVSKRRSEIEQRRKAELQKQDDERLEDRQRRVEQFAVQRKREQIKVDEQKMRIRHENMLNAANFLQTEAEPKIYYRPWDLLPDEEDRIDDQIRDTQARIDEEVAEFEAEKRRRLNDLGDSPDDQKTNVPESEDPGPEIAASPAEAQDTEKPNGDADQQPPAEPTNATDNADQMGVPDSGKGKVREDEASEKEAQAIPGDTTTLDVTDEKKEAEEQSKEAEEDVEEEADHIVVGDEDTVEY